MGWMGCLLGMKEYVNKELDSKIFIENNVYKKLLMLQKNAVNLKLVELL